MRIDIWSDIACPWCYIGKRRLEAALADFEHRDDVTLTWHAFQLDPTLPEHYDGTELDYLVKRKHASAEQVAAMMGHVTATAAKDGLAYDFDRLVVANSLRAHRLLHVAQRTDPAVAERLQEDLMRAHFVQGRDTGAVDVLVDLATAAGLEEAAVRAGLDDPQIAAAVEADFATAAEYGIGGVPFFVFDDRLAVSGAQPADLFTKGPRPGVEYAEDDSDAGGRRRRRLVRPGRMCILTLQPVRRNPPIRPGPAVVSSTASAPEEAGTAGESCTTTASFAAGRRAAGPATD